jgi:CarboxypepD_reg-like domain/TonB-dependent Receptor Plug Domain
MHQQLTLFFLLLTTLLQAQNATLVGRVSDAVTGEGVEFATIFIKGSATATEANVNGNFQLQVPADTRIEIVCSRIGYEEKSIIVNPLKAGSRKRIDVALKPNDAGFEIEVTESRIEEQGMIKEEVTTLKLLPIASGNFESVLPSIALGTNSGSGGELSSQYQVRGGNYDENLVYVNDFEIYRPQLIRSGQQEGLTFANIDLIRDLSFSSGGFQALYGDKLSSVLDVKYKRPDSLHSSVSMSFLGASAHVEGSVKADSSSYRRFRYLAGARYKTTKYILGSLDVTGEYTPNFVDIQTYLTYDINRDWQVGFLGNYNRSEYQFIPATRSTALGLIDFALELFTVFEGQEIDEFITTMGGLSFTYLPDRKRNPFYLKFLTSAFQSDETERFDIIGDYRLGEIESDLGSDNFGEVVSVLGTGTQHLYTRNYLTSNVYNAQVQGGLEIPFEKYQKGVSGSHFFQWGATFQNEIIDDELNEWERLDSAGYAIPYDTTTVQIQSVLKTRNNLNSNRYTAFIQETFTHNKDSLHEMKLTFGVRGQYWDLNQELFVSPRAQFLFKPLNIKKDISYKVSAGLYYQAPFYRELRNLQGVVNTDVQSQKSFHFVAGMTYDFYMGRYSPKKFKFITELYYKRLWDLVSYDVDNVRIRYSGENDATGYIAGIDMRINGEFVPGVESWINMSFLRAREKLNGVQHMDREFGEPEAKEVSDVPRPTDRFMTLNMFFQDYLPKNKNFKTHINLSFGTGLPYGLKDDNKIFRNTYRFSPYHRVDIGFSIQLWKKEWRQNKPRHPLRFSDATWLSLEVFNLLAVQNAASNTWIKTIYNSQFAIPNYLTGRRINLRLKMDF